MLRFNSVTEKFDMYWVSTGLPKEMVDIIENELPRSYDVNEDTLDYGTVGNRVNLNIRKSKVKFIPTTTWIGALCYYFVDIANKDNFQYNIASFQDNTIQYTTYTEGEFYNWHNDTDSPDPNGMTRKLSFILQLSDPDEYEGGTVQILTSSSNELLTVPKERGVITVFDSSLKHRVLKIKSGLRKSLVGWVVGPRFV